MPILFTTALAIIAAEPASSRANADLTALYDSICGGHEDPGGEFRSVMSSEIPHELIDLYVHPYEGRYWRRQGERPAFVVLTRGPGHWIGVEEYCIVGVQGATLEPVVDTFSRRMNDPTIFRNDEAVLSWERPRTTGVTLLGNRTMVGVSQHPDGWVSLITGGHVTRSWWDR